MALLSSTVQQGQANSLFKVPPADSVSALVAATSVTCAGRTDGRIDLLWQSGQTPLGFQWQSMTGSAMGSGIIPDSFGLASIPDLASGNYSITLVAANGMSETYLVTVPEPLLLEAAAAVLTDYHGYGVSCINSFDGSATVQPTGGTPYYNYKWSNGSPAPQVNNLSPGKYDVTVTDQHGCTAKSSVLLDAPTPLLAEAVVKGEKCLGENTGEIHLQSISGGLPPYQVSLQGSPFGDELDWTGLAPGQYFLVVRDDNGCKRQVGAVLPTGLEFNFDAGPDTSIFSGDTLRFHFSAGRPLASTSWEPAEYAQVVGSGEALLFPFANTHFQVTSVDTNGCTAIDDLYVDVHRKRAVYAPNVFAPLADDLTNQVFTFYAGGGVEEISLLQVFNRAGKMVFENQHFSPGVRSQGWQGDLAGGEDAPGGVYFWYAVVRYTDGRLEEMRGDVTLLR